MKNWLPNRNYLAAYSSGLINAGDRLNGAIKNVLLSLVTTGLTEEFATELRLASKNWTAAKQGILGLAGKTIAPMV